jgi:hypothetical protein
MVSKVAAGGKAAVQPRHWMCATSPARTPAVSPNPSGRTSGHRGFRPQRRRCGCSLHLGKGFLSGV